GWDEQSGSGCIIQEATINETSISNNNAIKISQSTFSGLNDANGAVLSIGGFSIISDNTIVSTYGKGYGIIVKNGLADIHGNIISGFAVGIWTASPASIVKNSILNCGVGIGVGKIIGTSMGTYEFGEVSVTITENTIANNYIGIGGPIFSGKVGINTVVATGEATTTGNYISNNTYGLALGAMGSFRYNTISNSLVAVTIYDVAAVYSPHMDSNNFESYSQNSMYMLGTHDMYAMENWWGTTDIDAINASIHDKIDNPLLGYVDFSAFLNSRNLQAPTEPPTPVPDLPLPNWSPTTLSNESPTPTPSNTTPNVTPTSGGSANYFQVESNSSITQLFFNSTSSELSFTVTGPSNTTGYVQYRIAKSLLASVQNVKVYLDGNQLNVNITSEGDSWLLYFTYHHSSHQVIINLNAQNNVAPEFTSLVWIVVPVAVGALLIITLALKRRKQNKAVT
ncbi:MAG TPA: hypothetical protein VLH35_05165, partial [Candidatus Acidoferrales bacterium]|nr:hypothetical protein [Candidatus Acidoferrales bacterium]